MKLYIVSAEHPDTGAQFNKVAVSQAECASIRAELTSLGAKRKDIDTHEVDVPTTKAEMVNFLNRLMSQPTVSDGVRQVAANCKLAK